MAEKKTLATAASVAVAGLVVAAGATAAIQANASTPKPTNGSNYGYGSPAGYGQQGDHQRGTRGTEVTGTELAKVKAAVVAKYPKVTVEHVMKDSSGAYHVMGTNGSTRVGYDVSKDLKTITVDQHQGGKGGQHGTPVTGTELTKVTAAVKAKDSAVTVQRVTKDSDGSYDVFGTKSGSQVMFEVSKDLKTITQNTNAGHQGQAQQGGEQVPA